ncbi:MAG: type IV pilus secretin PilQ, partial [Desulfobacula sp.]|nr:type IV pilus secretin PilQ [Desulfobacula sp.]
MNQTVTILCSKYRIIPLIIILYCLILGCSSHDNVVEKIDHFEKWRILAEKSQSVTPVHEKRPAQQSPAMESKSPPRQAPSFKKKEDVPEATPQLPEVPVTMRMHDVSVTVLLRTLARIADINIMINKSISGQVNVDIKSVPWNHVFLSLLDTYGLTYEWSGLILRVITVADLNKKKELMEAKQDYQQSKDQHSIAMLQIKKKQDWFEPLQTKIIKIQYADIKVMQHNLEEYLTTE